MSADAPAPLFVSVQRTAKGPANSVGDLIQLVRGLLVLQICRGDFRRRRMRCVDSRGRSIRLLRRSDAPDKLLPLNTLHPANGLTLPASELPLRPARPIPQECATSSFFHCRSPREVRSTRRASTKSSTP